MLTRVPDYYEAFHCLAGACPHTCCEKWEVVVDEETARRYQETPGSLGERLYDAKMYLMTADLLGCGRRSRRTRRGISASPSGAAGAPF